MLKWLFLSKRNELESKLTINIHSNIIAEIESIDMLGEYITSENNKYLLLLQDSDANSGRMGFRNSGNGRFALAKTNEVLFIKECERPFTGAVANNGIFVICDAKFGNKLQSNLMVYGVSGDLILSHEFSANLLNLGISEYGDYIAAQLCNSDTVDGGKLFIFDVNNLKVLSEFIPSSGWADKYEFEPEEQAIFLCYKNKQKQKYSFHENQLKR